MQRQIQPVAPAHPSQVDERPIPQFHRGFVFICLSRKRTRTLQSGVYLKLLCSVRPLWFNKSDIGFERDEPEWRGVINCSGYRGKKRNDQKKKDVLPACLEGNGSMELDGK